MRRITITDLVYAARVRLGTRAPNLREFGMKDATNISGVSDPDSFALRMRDDLPRILPEPILDETAQPTGQTILPSPYDAPEQAGARLAWERVRGSRRN